MMAKVLFITSGMCKGGAETQLVKLALFLRSLDYTILIISLKPINEFNIDYEKAGIPVLFLNSWPHHPLDNSKKLYDAVRAFKPDVVIAFMFIAIIFARLLKKMLKFRLISTIRIAVIPRKWYMLFKLTSGLDDVIVYNSNASRESFESKQLVAMKGVVINNGVLIPDLEKSTAFNTETKPFLWVCIAHFRWNKDYKTLFKAIALLKEHDFRVDIIGAYTKKDDPKHLIKQLKIERFVNVLGFRQNTGEYLKDADAFVLSSHSEGMPNALLEAMAYSKPVVVTNIPCNYNVLQHSSCGFLSELENERDLASRMLLMMKMPIRTRNTLGENGRRYIQSNFSEKEVMNSWLNVVNEQIVTDSPLISVS